jgi:hypothetical protein
VGREAGLLFLPSPVSTGDRLRGGTRAWRAVNEAVATTNARSFEFPDVDAALQFANVVEPALQEGYRLLAAHAAGIEPNLGTALMARFLIARQRPPVTGAV